MGTSAIISLSTSYLQSKYPDGYEMLCRAAELGFEYVELGHSTPLTSINGITKALNENIVKVSSLHNFCPLPNFAKGAAPNLFSPATGSEIESSQWLRHTRNTIAFAKQCKAKAIVCHLGAILYFFINPANRLKGIINSCKPETLAQNNAYQKAKERFLKSSKNKSKKNYLNIVKNISELAKDLEDSGILIGMENREGIAELPLDWNFEALIEACKDYSYAKVWHDVGHSKIKEILGLTTQLDLLEKTSENICGWHLHDCNSSGKDHIGIGKGDIDFQALKKYFDAKKHIFVLELNAMVDVEDVIYSRKFVEDILS